MQEPAATPLKFQPFSSSPDLTFWHELSKRKLETFKLSEEAVPIAGTYRAGVQRVGMPAVLGVSSDSFNAEDPNIAGSHYLAPGLLYNTNTIEGFKQLDKNAIFASLTQSIWESICSGAAEEDPSVLSRFFIISYSDLKKYKFGFPALPVPGVTASAPQSISVLLNPPQLEDLKHKASQHRGQSLRGAGFFLLRQASSSTVDIGPLNEWKTFWQQEEQETAAATGGGATGGGALTSSPATPIIALADPGGTEEHPGWPLRNLLWMVCNKWKLKEVTIVCLRDKAGSQGFADSIVLNVNLPDSKGLGEQAPKAVGWERNQKGKLGHRSVNLGATMNPEHLASTAVDLNLKLMKWRLASTLDLAKVASTKCLLLGSGTLGCNVARSLLGWGVRHLTFVDNGTVSFSNPVRQTLFKFEDCLDGGKPKAEAAAAAIKAIFPEAQATGHRISIPMPGHPIGGSLEAKSREAVALLDQLVSTHDVVFLLTDSREARWMGTVL